MDIAATLFYAQPSKYLRMAREGATIVITCRGQEDITLTCQKPTVVPHGVLNDPPTIHTGKAPDPAKVAAARSLMEQAEAKARAPKPIEYAPMPKSDIGFNDFNQDS